MEASAIAAGLPFDPSSFANPLSIIDGAVISGVVKGLGLTMDHRAYEPATAMGPRGFDVGVEATLTQFPADFGAALTSAGMSGAENLPFLPVPRLNIHKGMSDKLDGGASFIAYGTNFRILGLELKGVIFEPEEGPTWALRFSYNNASIKMSNVATFDLSIKTFTPQLLISRKLDFADPYIGIGYQYVIGTVTVTVPLPPPSPIESISDSATGRGSALQAFTGVSLKIVPIGIRLTMEGSYSPSRSNSLGVKVSFNF